MSLHFYLQVLSAALQADRCIACVIADQYDYTAGARRFDGGERSNFITLPAAASSLRQLAAWGAHQGAISEYLAPIVRYAAARATAAGLVAPPTAHQADHMIGVQLPEALGLGPADLQGLAASLLEKGVHVSIRGAAIRISPHLWTEMADIDNLFDVLEGLLAAVPAVPAVAAPSSKL
jgi:selenocysteine lyase/cysteine desulfurase